MTDNMTIRETSQLTMTDYIVFKWGDDDDDDDNDDDL